MMAQGDPRVLFALNAVLSGLFSTIVVWGLSFIGLLEFGWTLVVLVTLGLMTLTWLVVLQ